MSAAVDTPIGRAHADAGVTLARAYAEHIGGYHLLPGDPLSAIDGLIVSWSNAVIAAVEAKIRTVTWAALLMYGDAYLISTSKISALRWTSRALGVRGVVLVQTSDGVRWAWNVSDARGRVTREWSRRISRTRATSVTADTVERDNSYLPYVAGEKW